MELTFGTADRPPTPAGTGLHLESYAGDHPAYFLYLAECSMSRDTADRLVVERYLSRGYAPSTAPGKRPFDVNELVICVAESPSANDVIGTMTVRLDGQSGLMCESVFWDEVAPFRIRAETLAEFGRLAVAEDQGLSLIGAMFNIALKLSVQRNIDRVFVEVNPRHVQIYHRGMGFETLGGVKICPRVNAEAVLMTATTERLLDVLARNRAKSCAEAAASGRLRYLPENAEAAILRRLMPRFAPLNSSNIQPSGVKQ